MGKKSDLTGQRFGKWTVLREVEERGKHGSIYWECSCECGRTSVVQGSHLTTGKSQSCGCSKKIDLTGRRFGKLVAVREVGKNKHRKVLWNCRCECGEEKIILSSSLLSGHTKSCGCSRYEDFTGQKFGKLTILNVTKQRTHRRVMWQYKCECGKDGYISSFSLEKGTKSCGCNQRGKNHWRYDPSIPDEVRGKRRYELEGNNHKKYSRKIYERDDFTCQSCNQRGYKLNAHHLNAWKSFPEQRFDTANGITLCEDCHKEYHHFNGRGNNTLEQFRDHIACTVGEEYVSEIEETLLSRESEIIGQEQEQPTRELQTT